MTNKECAETILVMYASYAHHYEGSTMIREAVTKAITALMNDVPCCSMQEPNEDTCDLPRFNALDYVR